MSTPCPALLIPPSLVDLPICNAPGTVSAPPATWTTPVQATEVLSCEHPIQRFLLSDTVAPDAISTVLDLARLNPTYMSPLELALGFV